MNSCRLSGWPAPFWPTPGTKSLPTPAPPPDVEGPVVEPAAPPLLLPPAPPEPPACASWKDPGVMSFAAVVCGHASAAMTPPVMMAVESASFASKWLIAFPFALLLAGECLPREYGSEAAHDRVA